MEEVDRFFEKIQKSGPVPKIQTIIIDRNFDDEQVLDNFEDPVETWNMINLIPTLVNRQI